MHAERLPWSIRVPSLLLIAQAAFLLERGHTDKHADTHRESQTQLITVDRRVIHRERLYHASHLISSDLILTDLVLSELSALRLVAVTVN